MEQALQAVGMLTGKGGQSGQKPHPQQPQHPGGQQQGMGGGTSKPGLL
jgi:hypothetical protein